MNAYIYQAALLCADCGEQVRQKLTAEGKAPSDPNNEMCYDSDFFPKGPYSNGGGEADNPQHCDHCSVFLENPLTSDGYEYVKQCVSEWLGVHKTYPTGTPVALSVWAPFYGIDLP